jgi:hypothetical protein
MMSQPLLKLEQFPRTADFLSELYGRFRDGNEMVYLAEGSRIIAVAVSPEAGERIVGSLGGRSRGGRDGGRGARRRSIGGDEHGPRRPEGPFSAKCYVGKIRTGLMA